MFAGSFAIRCDSPFWEAGTSRSLAYRHIAFGFQVEFFGVIEIDDYVSVNGQETTGIKKRLPILQALPKEIHQ